MKTILIFCLTFHGILSDDGPPNGDLSQQNQPAPTDGAKNNAKIAYEKLSWWSRIENYGLPDTKDSEDLKKVELQFLRKHDSICVGEQYLKPAVSTLVGYVTGGIDDCEKDFSSNPFFSSKHIEFAKQKGTTEDKLVEFTHYDVNPSTISFKLHKCSCTVNSDNDDSKSICIDGSAYITEGVGGDDSYFVLQKAQNTENFNLRAHITLTQTPAQPEPKPEEKPQGTQTATPQ